MTRRVTRRSFLATASVAGVSSIAGCLRKPESPKCSDAYLLEQKTTWHEVTISVPDSKTVEAVIQEVEQAGYTADVIDRSPKRGKLEQYTIQVTGSISKQDLLELVNKHVSEPVSESEVASSDPMFPLLGRENAVPVNTPPMLTRRVQALAEMTPVQGLSFPGLQTIRNGWFVKLDSEANEREVELVERAVHPNGPVRFLAGRNEVVVSHPRNGEKDARGTIQPRYISIHRTKESLRHLVDRPIENPVTLEIDFQSLPDDVVTDLFRPASGDGFSVQIGDETVYQREYTPREQRLIYKFNNNSDYIVDSSNRFVRLPGMSLEVALQIAVGIQHASSSQIVLETVCRP